MVLGVTGGIGAGKSLVCQLFHGLGIPVYDSDKRAKALMSDDPVLVAQIKAHFGAETYLEDGVLNRAFLAQQVFSDTTQLDLLNSLVHPAVGKDFDQWKAASGSNPYSIKEAAILIESGAYKSVDVICVVTAPENSRVQRVVERDGVSESDVRARMNNQMTDEARLEYADFVITNDGKSPLLQQVVHIHEHLINSL